MQVSEIRVFQDADGDWCMTWYYAGSQHKQVLDATDQAEARTEAAEYHGVEEREVRLRGK